MFIHIYLCFIHISETGSLQTVCWFCISAPARHFGPNQSVGWMIIASPEKIVRVMLSAKLTKRERGCAVQWLQRFLGHLSKMLLIPFSSPPSPSSFNGSLFRAPSNTVTTVTVHKQVGGAKRFGNGKCGRASHSASISSHSSSLFGTFATLKLTWHFFLNCCLVDAVYWHTCIFSCVSACVSIHQKFFWNCVCERYWLRYEFLIHLFLLQDNATLFLFTLLAVLNLEWLTLLVYLFLWLFLCQ